jgi:hypothetical protein
MQYNPKTMQLEGKKPEIPESGIAERIINNIIWGNSHYNPNNKHDNRNTKV